MSALRLEIPEYELPVLPEPRNGGESALFLSKQRTLNNILNNAKRLFEPYVDEPGVFTTGYVAQVLFDDQHRPTGFIRIGNPKSNGSGPYLYDIEKNICSCPFFEEKHYCKHNLGILQWLSECEYTISQKGYIIWKKSNL